MRILLATSNPGKLREIRQMTTDAAWEWIGLADYPDVPEAVEDGDTFAENARRKALHYARATGLPTLADDSGLEVDALGGAPGVHSARYAGEPKDDLRNNEKLIETLRGVPEALRTARFRCAMAFVAGEQVVCEADGAIEGIIIDEPRGSNGFGYDPHFRLPQLGLTTAELTPERKNKLSHRGRALRAILPRIEAWRRAVGSDSANA